MDKFNTDITLLFVSLIATILGVFGDTYSNGKITNRGYFAIALAIIAVILSVFQKIEEKNDKITDLLSADSTRRSQQEKYDFQVNRLENIIAKLEDQAVTQEEISNTSNRIESNQFKLDQRYSSLNSTTSEIKDNIFDTDSYCYVMPKQLSSNRNEIFLTLQQKGKYPLKPLHIEMMSMEESNKKVIPKDSPTSLGPYTDLYRTTPIDYPLLAKGEQKILEYRVSGAKEFNLTFVYSANTGIWYQMLKMRFIKEGNTEVGAFATVVYKENPKKRMSLGKVMFELAHPGYPRDKNGKIDWSK